MALFSLKKKSGTPAKKTAVARVAVTSVSSRGGDISVLLRPRITEKVTMLAQKGNVYTFNVSPDATKQSIASAIVSAYKVSPLRVRVVTIPRKEVFIRGKRGVKAGGKKAYVYLKAGDKIEL